MEREKLEQLRDMKRESVSLEKKIEERKSKRKPKLHGDTAADYSTGHKRVITIYGEADPVMDKYIRLLEEKKMRVDHEIYDMESWLDRVEPARTRNVLRLYYQEGKSQREIGELLNIDRSLVSKIISEAFK